MSAPTASRPSPWLARAAIAHLAAAVIPLTLLLTACDTPSSPSAKPNEQPAQQAAAPIPARNPAPVSNPAPTPIPPADTERYREIQDLIEQLAISDEPAGNAPIYSPMPDTPPTDKRVIAYKAAAKLKTYGKEAFPILLGNRGDNRQSVAFRRVIPHAVGFACYCIVEDQIYNLPRGYRGSFYRKGADGEMHERPYFLAPGPFDDDTIDAWLEARKDTSLADMQIETLQWLIEKEKAIGFPEEADRDSYLHPLERQVTELRAAPKK